MAITDKIASLANDTAGAVGGIFNMGIGESIRQQYPGTFIPPDYGIPDKIDQKSVELGKRAGKSLLRGMKQVAASGFGKGLLFVATVAILASGLWQGFAAYAASQLFMDGLAVGAASATQFLFGSLGGLTTLAFGGALGAVTEVQREQSRINADIAQAEANRYEILRLRQEIEAQKPQQREQSTRFRDMVNDQRAATTQQQRSV